MLSDPTARSYVDAFAESARNYCAWAEGLPLEPHEELTVARRLLVELHRAAIYLPDNCPERDTEDKLNAEDWKKVCSRFQNLPVNGYWDVFDPLAEAPPVFNTLWDDLTDIYRDVKEGLILFDEGRVEEAIWEWRFNFEIHWGGHLTGAQRAIHAYFS